MANATALPAKGLRRIPALLALFVTIALLTAVAAFGLAPTMMQPNPDRWQLARLTTALGIPLLVIASWHQIRSARARRAAAGVAVAVEEDEQRREHASRTRLDQALATLHGPITSIHAFSSHLSDRRLADADDVAQLSELIERDAAEAVRIVENLLSASQLAAGTLEVAGAPIDLLDIARSESGRLDPGTRSVQVHGDTTFAWADPTLIGRVVRNLTSNAMRHGGDRIDIVVRGDAKSASLIVADDGIGLPDKENDRISDTSETGSVDLADLSGLTVAAAIAVAMDGALEYERRLGWTNLILTLPVAPADVLATMTDATSGPAADPEVNVDVDASAPSDSVLTFDDVA